MKWLVKLLGVFFLLMIFAVTAVPLVVSKEDIKNELIAQIEHKTGYRVAIDGEVALEVVPNIAIKTPNISIKNKENFPLLKADSLFVSVALWPLLEKKIEINTLTLGNASFGYDAQKKQWAVTQANLDSTIKSFDQPMDIKGNLVVSGRAVVLAATLGSLNSLLTQSKSDVDFQVSHADISASGKGIITPISYNGTITISHIITNAAGTLRADWSQKIPMIQAELATKTLDLRSVTTKHTENRFSLISSAHAASGPWSDTAYDFSALSKVNADVTIKADKMQVADVEFSHALLAIKLQNSRMNGTLTASGFYGGDLALNALIDNNATPAAVQTRLLLSKIDLQSFLKAYAGTERFTGKADLSLNATSQGVTQRELIANMRGSGDLSSPEGVIRGVDLNALLSNVATAFQSVRSDNQKTPYGNLTASFTINRGVVSNNDLVMQLDKGRVTGMGQIDLPQFYVNYRLEPAMAVAVRNKDGSTRADAIAVPVIIEGSLDAPQFTADLQAVVRDVINDPRKYKQQIKTLKEEYKKMNSLKDIGKLLQGIEQNK